MSAMKQFKFDISLPEGRSRSYIFYNEERAEAALQDFLEKDSRFNPSQIKESFLPSNAIIVDENNRYQQHDVTGLNFVGSRDFHASNGTRKEKWYSLPGHENEVKTELEKAKLSIESSRQKSPAKNLISRILD